MTPRERILAVLQGKRVDRVPLVLPGFECPSRQAADQIDDPRKRAVAQRLFDHLAVRVVQYKDRIKLQLPSHCPVKSLLHTVTELLFQARPPPLDST